tara:strand:+ start:2105 stop:2449 length:345 start_codon:yes stop_codon:yes gene_type:complete
MKNRNIKKKFPVPVYETDFYVEIVKDPNITVHDHVETKQDIVYDGGFVYYDDKKIIVLPYNASPDLVAHESLHCMDKILQDINYEYRYMGEETAWLLGYIVKCCHETEKLRKKK